MGWADINDQDDCLDGPFNAWFHMILDETVPGNFRRSSDQRSWGVSFALPVALCSKLPLQDSRDVRWFEITHWPWSKGDFRMNCPVSGCFTQHQLCTVASTWWGYLLGVELRRAICRFGCYKPFQCSSHQFVGVMNRMLIHPYSLWWNQNPDVMVLGCPQEAPGSWRWRPHGKDELPWERDPTQLPSFCILRIRVCGLWPTGGLPPEPEPNHAGLGAPASRAGGNMFLL